MSIPHLKACFIRNKIIFDSIFEISYQGPGDGSVTLATKLEMFFDTSCHVVSMYKILLSVTE